MRTEPVEVRGGLLAWPSDVPEDAWLLAYTHSELLLGKGPKPLHPTKLYDAWAFDGKASWHLWRRDDEWVCTRVDAQAADRRLAGEQRQLLSDAAVKKLKAQGIDVRYLVIHERYAFDRDGQAYVAYSCPINLE